MNLVQAKKLSQSKWTKVTPKDKEKHFMVTEVKYTEEGLVSLCVIQAVYSQNEYEIDWRDLKDASIWRLGWC